MISKYKYNNRYQFSFNQKIDNRQYKSNQTSGITLHLLTAYSGEADDIAYAEEIKALADLYAVLYGMSSIF